MLGDAALRDRRILYVTAFIRALATGLVGVLLGLHLVRLEYTAIDVGIVVSAGLTGGACASLLATLVADRRGRGRFLLELALLGTAGGAVVALGSSPLLVSVAAFLGMLNGTGRDRGAALVLEQAMLPATTTARDRTRVFAWYNVLQDAGHAVGALLAGLPWVFQELGQVAAPAASRITLGLYALLILVTAFLYGALSPAVEGGPARTRVRVSPESRRVLWRISSLFALDSLGGGFLATALLSLFFHQRFGVGEGTIGLLFFGARVANALSHLGAAWLAERIGLVRTMVFTHVPSSLLLLTVPIAPTFWVAALLFLLREGLVEMDVPTRQSYVMAVVREEERTVASGVTHLVRLAAWAVAPVFAGLTMEGFGVATPLLCGAALKLLYDALLYGSFRNLRPPEEA